MRPGLTPGAEAWVRVTVTGEMLARFEDLGLVHPVYSTWSMVRHMELASRKVILPYLEPGEEAIGHSVSVTHRAPTPLGATVTAHAQLVSIEGNQIICAVTAHNGRTTIGDGTTIQVLVDAEALRARFTEIGARAAG
jgi:predicted thioesterase